MKQIQLSQFDPARLFTYVLSRLVESHGAEGNGSKGRISSGEAAVARSPNSTSSSSNLEDILRTTQRRWPSRYY